MATNFVEKLRSELKGEPLRLLADRLGLHHEQAADTIQMASLSLLAGLLGRAESAYGPSELEHVLANESTYIHRYGGWASFLDNFEGLLRYDASGLEGNGAVLANQILGHRANSVASTIGDLAGIPHNRASALLFALAPLVVGMLRSFLPSNLSGESIKALLESERENMLSSLPVDLSNLLGVTAHREDDATARAFRATIPLPRAYPQPGGHTREPDQGIEPPIHASEVLQVDEFAKRHSTQASNIEPKAYSEPASSERLAVLHRPGEEPESHPDQDQPARAVSHQEHQGSSEDHEARISLSERELAKLPTLPQPDTLEVSRLGEELAGSERHPASLRDQIDQADRLSNEKLASLNQALKKRDQDLEAEQEKHLGLRAELDALRAELQRLAADALQAEQERRTAEEADQTRRDEAEKQRLSELEAVRRQRDDIESKASSLREEFALERKQFEAQIAQLTQKVTEQEEERAALEELLHTSRADLNKLTAEFEEAERHRHSAQESLENLRASEQTHLRLHEDRIFELRQAAQSRERELAAVARERDALQADSKRLREQIERLQSRLEAKSLSERSSVADLPSAQPATAVAEPGVAPAAPVHFLADSPTHPATSASSHEAITSATSAGPTLHLSAGQEPSPQGRIGRTAPAPAPAQEPRSNLSTTMHPTKASVPGRMESEPREEYALWRPPVFRWLATLAWIALGLLVLTWLSRQFWPSRLELEGGKSIEVPNDSVLTSIIPFLKAKGEGESQSFTWNHLYFDGKSNTLSASSVPSVTAMAAVLHAYPNARIKIVVHPYNSGDRGKDVADATLRANALRAALVDRGIFVHRIQTEAAQPGTTGSIVPFGMSNREGEIELVVSR